MNDSADEISIRETIGHYTAGMKAGDVKVLRRAFHELAILCGYFDDKVITAPIQGLYDWVESNGIPESYNCSILDIEVTGRVATARIHEADSHGEYVDHFHLVKLDGDRWMIVSKIWDSSR